MKVYTKKGDKGETSLFGGARVSKSSLRIEAYGTVDELNSYLGVVSDHLTDETVKKMLISIQVRLFTIGANLATDPAKEGKIKGPKTPDVLEDDITFLEKEIDSMEEQLELLRFFILPGGHPAVSFCHVTRCVCRRAERLVVRLSENERVDELIVKYLNRLSDFLFVLARKIGHDLKVKEIPWKPDRK